jgi:hypothetical protein
MCGETRFQLFGDTNRIACIEKTDLGDSIDVSETSHLQQSANISELEGSDRS